MLNLAEKRNAIITNIRDWNVSKSLLGGELLRCSLIICAGYAWGASISSIRNTRRLSLPEIAFSAFILSHIYKFNFLNSLNHADLI
jgi:hypothetical protein